MNENSISWWNGLLKTERLWRLKKYDKTELNIKLTSSMLKQYVGQGKILHQRPDWLRKVGNTTEGKERGRNTRERGRESVCVCERERDRARGRDRNAVFSFSSLTLRRVGVHLASGHVGISLVVPNFISPQSSLRMWWTFKEQFYCWRPHTLNCVQWPSVMSHHFSIERNNNIA